MRLLISFASVVLLTACTTSVTQAPVTEPLSVSKLPREGMVVTANPHATQAGADVLNSGGSAVDAAIAIQAVLSLVEPQSSGLGGGGFMVYYDAKSKQLAVYDGRETAPAGATDTQFLTESGESIGFLNAKHSGLSTGVPGMVSLLSMAHADHGVLPWGSQFNNAIALAEQGFAISPRLYSLIERFGKYLPKQASEGPTDAYHYFYGDDGQPRAVGSLLLNPDYARTLRRLAQDPRDFYHGEIAQQIVAQAGLSPRAGSLSMADMAAYNAVKRDVVCAAYRVYKLCGPPPASSWLAVGMIAGILESGPAFRPGGAESAVNWQLFADAQRLAYADRDQYVADTEYVSVPVLGMLDSDYLATRAALLKAGKGLPVVEPGDPWVYESRAASYYGKDATEDMAGTTHFVVVDGEGNVVSMTASVESIFGSARMAGGMFLNNQLTDFSFQPRDAQGQYIANRVQPGKRPRSSMSPTIVLNQADEFVMATGSPGGNSIIAYTAKTLVGVLDWGLTPQQAVDLPNMVARGDKVRIERERASAELVDGLRAMGLTVAESEGENSGLSVVLKDQNGALHGGVDPRREGVIERVVFEQ